MAKPHVPSFVTDTLAALRAERAPMGARIDAIDLAIENVRRVWPEADPVRGGVLHLSQRRNGKGSDARAVVLTAVGKAKLGLTIQELKQQTPSLSGTQRRNALQRLKTAKEIRRSGKTWVAA